MFLGCEKESDWKKPDCSQRSRWTFSVSRDDRVEHVNHGDISYKQRRKSRKWNSGEISNRAVVGQANPSLPLYRR